jgi:DNA-binding NarL/FixJ family response regulator
MLSNGASESIAGQINLASGGGRRKMTGAILEAPVSRLPRARKRLVIVADNSLLAEAIRHGFRASGEFYVVGYAHEHTAAARTILDAEPDAILLDDLDQSQRSIELLRAIRSEDPTVAVLVHSIHLSDDWLARAFGAGATAVISKATQPAALVTLVRETLKGYIVHKPLQAAPTDDRGGATDMEGLPLTRRELEVLQLLAYGSTNSVIARRLWITEQTVKFHLGNIYRKLDVANRTQASHFAHAHGLVDFAATPERALSVAAA